MKKTEIVALKKFLGWWGKWLITLLFPFIFPVVVTWLFGRHTTINATDYALNAIVVSVCFVLLIIYGTPDSLNEESNSSEPPELSFIKSWCVTWAVLDVSTYGLIIIWKWLPIILGISGTIIYFLIRHYKKFVAEVEKDTHWKNSDE